MSRQERYVDPTLEHLFFKWNLCRSAFAILNVRGFQCVLHTHTHTKQLCQCEITSLDDACAVDGTLARHHIGRPGPSISVKFSFSGSCGSWRRIRNPCGQRRRHWRPAGESRRASDEDTSTCFESLQAVQAKGGKRPQPTTALKLFACNSKSKA